MGKKKPSRRASEDGLPADSGVISAVPASNKKAATPSASNTPAERGPPPQKAAGAKYGKEAAAAKYSSNKEFNKKKADEKPASGNNFSSKPAAVPQQSKQFKQQQQQHQQQRYQPPQIVESGVLDVDHGHKIIGVRKNDVACLALTRLRLERAKALPGSDIKAVDGGTAGLDQYRPNLHYVALSYRKQGDFAGAFQQWAKVSVEKQKKRKLLLKKDDSFRVLGSTAAKPTNRGGAATARSLGGEGGGVLLGGLRIGGSDPASQSSQKSNDVSRGATGRHNTGGGDPRIIPSTAGPDNASFEQWLENKKAQQRQTRDETLGKQDQQADGQNTTTPPPQSDLLSAGNAGGALLGGLAIGKSSPPSAPSRGMDELQLESLLGLRSLNSTDSTDLGGLFTGGDSLWGSAPSADLGGDSSKPVGTATLQSSDIDQIAKLWSSCGRVDMAATNAEKAAAKRQQQSQVNRPVTLERTPEKSTGAHPPGVQGLSPPQSRELSPAPPQQFAAAPTFSNVPAGATMIRLPGGAVVPLVQSNAPSASSYMQTPIMVGAGPTGATLNYGNLVAVAATATYQQYPPPQRPAGPTGAQQRHVPVLSAPRPTIYQPSRAPIVQAPAPPPPPMQATAPSQAPQAPQAPAPSASSPPATAPSAAPQPSVAGIQMAEMPSGDYDDW